MRVFLDMDGVLVNFIAGAARLFGMDYDELLSKWTPGTYDMESILGISKSEFFRKIDSAGQDFWANLPEYPYSRELYNHCLAIAPTYILTSPTMHPSSLSGKLEWLNRWFGRGFRDYFMTSNKGLLADKSSLLIDDKQENVDNFISCGGRAITFPGINNPRYIDLSQNMLLLMKSEIDGMIMRCGKCKLIKLNNEFSKNQDWCKSCYREYSLLHKAECLENGRRSYQKNKEKQLTRSREKHLRLKFGITEGIYEDFLMKQDGKCAICGKEQKDEFSKHGKPCHFSIDHDHTNGSIRGLLCRRCNYGLGLFGDSSALLKKATTYLENKN